MLLRGKLILLLLPLLLLPVGTVAWIAYELLAHNMIERSEQEARNLLTREVQNFQRLKTNAVASLHLLEAYPVLRQFLLTDDEDLRYNLLQPSLLKTFAIYQQQYPYFNEIRVILPDGFEDIRRTIGLVPNATEQEAQSEFFQRWQTLDPRSVDQTILVNPDDGELVLLLGKKLMLNYRGLDPMHAEPQLRGYLGITVGLKAFAEQLEARRFGDSGRLLLTDAEGRRVRIDGNTLPVTEFEHARFTPLYTSRSSLTTLGDQRLVYWSQPIRDDLVVTALLPEEELLAPTRSLAWAVLLVSVFAVLALMLSIYLTLQRLIINRLSRLNEAARAITAGDLKSRIDDSADDEIGRLSETFNAMQRSLLRSRTEVQRYQQELERKVVQEQAASQAKSDFLAKMSHEIRTPMNGVIGSLELLLSDALTERQYRFARVARDSATGLLDIINDILDFSKIEVGRLELAHKEFNLRHEVVTPAIEILMEKARQKGLKLEARLEQGVVPDLMGDPVRLRQVLINLLGNAVKFTDAGYVRLRISVQAQDRQGTLLRFEVKDTGTGLQPEEIDRIFDSFSQADNSSSRRYGGTGLGLSIARQLVELMGGEIRVESEPGEGSRFWFEVPFEIPQQPKSHASAATTVQAAIPPQSTRGMRVLLVDDNALSKEIGKDMLQSLGCDLAICENGREALDALEASRYDLVLMDCHMPVMNGYQATRELRRRETYTGRRRTPVIAVTADAFVSDKQSASASGMDDFLLKPYLKEELQGMLLRWGKSRTAQAKIGV